MARTFPEDIANGIKIKLVILCCLSDTAQCGP